MKRWIVLLLLAGPVAAAEVDINWDEEPSAIAYRTYISSDLGITWTLAVETSGMPQTVPVPDTGLHLLRACTVLNGNIDLCRYDSGLWVNAEWSLRPINLNIQ